MGKITPKDLHFAVVLYNKCGDESVTCRYLQAHSYLGIHITIVDNSTSDYGNDAFCAEQGWDYISMGGNAGLSRAYNRVLEALKGSAGYVIWCYDDSEFDSSYLEQVLLYLNKCGDKYQVYAPLVFTGDKIYSPNRIDKSGFIQRLKSIEELDSKRISAINSGLVVDLRVYQNYRYDVEMFLDYIDHDFCLFCLRTGVRIRFMKHAVIRQNSFFEERPSREKLKKRREIYEKDYIRYLRRNELNLIKGYKKLYAGKMILLLQGIRKG